jgi:hypothetical protein
VSLVFDRKMLLSEIKHKLIQTYSMLASVMIMLQIGHMEIGTWVSQSTLEHPDPLTISDLWNEEIF